MSLQKIVPEGQKRAFSVSGSFKRGVWTPHVSMLADVARMTDPVEMKERIKTSWSTMGIVSALILTMTYPSIITPVYGSPPAVYDENYEILKNDPLMQTFSTLNVMSFTLALTIDIVVVVLMTQLDLCCTPEHTREFLIKFAAVNEALTGVFSCSILILGAQVMTVTWYNFSDTVNIATLAFWGVFILLVAIMSTSVAIFNRFQISVRGKELMKEVVATANVV